MTILILTNHFNTGGITSYVQTLTRSLCRSGDRVLVASAGGDGVKDLLSSGAQHYYFNFKVKSEIHPALFCQLLRLVRLIREERVDIIHAQTRVTQMMAAMASCIAKIPFVGTCHGFFRPHWGRRLFPLWGEKVIAISAPVYQHLRNDLRAPDGKIMLIPNGIDLGAFMPPDEAARMVLRQQWGVGDEPILGIIARLSDVKGHQFLIAAMPQVLKMVPRARCFIFGQGPEEKALKRQVKLLKLEESVSFYPVINHTAAVMPLLDLFVMPSLQEGLGLSVLEAAAMQVPAVVTRVGGLPDTVLPGETGIVVAPRDAEALAEALGLLLSDRARTRSMGLKARIFVHERYDAARMAGSTRELYSQVVGAHD